LRRQNRFGAQTVAAAPSTQLVHPDNLERVEMPTASVAIMIK